MLRLVAVLAAILSTTLLLPAVGYTTVILPDCEHPTPLQWSVNGHYYELVDTAAPINWYDARDAAAARTFRGETGYLATVTSQAEQDALFALLGGVDALSNHWLGGCGGPTKLDRNRGALSEALLGSSSYAARCWGWTPK